MSAHGSATPMRGKSLTCRKCSSEFAVYDSWSKTLRKDGNAAGKSETCRASGWRSHRHIASFGFRSVEADDDLAINSGVNLKLDYQ